MKVRFVHYKGCDLEVARLILLTPHLLGRNHMIGSGAGGNWDLGSVTGRPCDKQMLRVFHSLIIRQDGSIGLGEVISLCHDTRTSEYQDADCQGWEARM